MGAVRLARAITGREVVVKFAGAYHGHSDGLLADAGSGLATLAVPASPGVTAAQAGGHGRGPLERPRGGRPRRWPSTRSRRCWPSRSRRTWASSRPPTASSSSSARRRAPHGALLVFDEVITGFRVARGGAQELYGVEPDLTVLGKVIGGGLPAAAFAGPRAAMERIAPAGDVYQAGTLSGNPLAVAAGLATLACPRRRRLRAPRRADRPPRRRLRRARRRPTAAGRLGPGPRDPLLQPRAGHRLRRRERLRPRGPRRASAARCSTAASTRRRPSSRPGSSRSPTTRRASTARSKPPPRHSTRRWDEAGRFCIGRRDKRDPPAAMSEPNDALRALAAQLREEDTPISPHVVDPAAAPRSAPASPPARAPPRHRASTRSWSRRCARATSSTTGSRGCSPATTPTSACSPATTSTRSASTVSPGSATPTPSRSSPT